MGGMRQKANIMWSNVGVNSNSFTKSGYLIKARESSLVNYSRIAWEAAGFISFPRALTCRETQTSLSRIWTWVTDSISCNGNRFSNSAS